MSSSLDETSEQIFTEKSFLQGALLAGVAYGTEVTLFAMTFWHLLRTRSSVNSKRKYIFLAYISVIFILGTLFYASNAQFTQLAFIDNRNIPGGPGVYEETSFSIPIDELGNVCAIMSTWFCDALLLWRFYVIYNTGRALWAIMFFPSLLFLGSFVTGLLFLLEVSASSPWSPGSPAASINWTIPFFSLSLSLNIILTIAITLRLLAFRRNIVSVMGTSHGSQYASIAAMIVESDAIFSIFSLLFLVPFAMNNPLNEVFFQALSGVQIIATLLIMFRVAQGKSWDTDTMTQGLTAGSLPFNTAGSSQLSAGGGRRGDYGMNEGHAMQRIQFTKPLPSGMSASALESTGASESTVRTLGGSKDVLSVAVDDFEKV